MIERYNGLGIYVEQQYEIHFSFGICNGSLYGVIKYFYRLYEYFKMNEVNLDSH